MFKALRYVFVLLAVALAALGFRVLPTVQFESDVMALFPQDAQEPHIAQANHLLAEGVTEKLFFLLSSTDWQATQQAAAAFADTLRLCDCIETVSARRDMKDVEALRRYYRAHAPVLLSDKDRVLLQQEKGKALLGSALRELNSEPEQPTAGSSAAPVSAPDPAGVSGEDELVAAPVGQHLMEDPFNTVSDFVGDLRDSLAGRGIWENGYLYFEDGNTGRRYLLVTAELADSPFSLVGQTAPEKVIETALAEFRQTVPNPDVVRTGTYFFAQAGAKRAGTEIVVVGAGSLLGVIVLLLLAFRSVWLLLLALLPTVAGVAAGLLVASLLFGSVHVVALVFATSLVGVSIDYSLHFLCKRQAMAEEWRPRAGFRALMPGLTLGMLTSVLGYAGFAVSGFAGLQQVAVMSCAGLLAAYLTVAGLYPWVLRKRAVRLAPRVIRNGIPRYLAAARHHLRRSRHPEWVLPVLILTGIGLWQLEMQDDVRAMQIPDDTLLEQETRYRELLGEIAASQYLLVQADTQEALLRKLEQLQAPLNAIEETDAVGSVLNLSEWVPSQATQQNNRHLLQTQVVEPGLLESYLEALKVEPEAQAKLVQAYLRPEENWLALNEILPLLRQLLQRPLYFSHQGKHYSLILLEGVDAAAPLRTLAKDSERVTWVDGIATAGERVRQYRETAMTILLGAYAIILLLLMVRYGWRGALAVVAPPLLASVIAVGLLGWLGIGLSIFSIMALLLVLGLGLDYTLFLRESRGRGYDTLYAIGLSSLTSLLSFGLLSLSATHAIFSFGVTVVLGIILSFLLAPLAISERQS